MEQQPPPTTVYTSTTEQPYMDNYEYTHTHNTHIQRYNNVHSPTSTQVNPMKSGTENSLASDSGLTCSTYNKEQETLFQKNFSNQ